MIFIMEFENGQNLSPQQTVGRDIPNHEILEQKVKNHYFSNSHSAFGSRDKYLDTAQLIWSSA